MPTYEIVILDKIKQSIITKLDQMERRAAEANQEINKLQRSLNRLRNPNINIRLPNNAIRTYNRNVNTARNRTRAWGLESLIASKRLKGLESSIFRTSQLIRSILSGGILLASLGGVVSGVDSFTKIQAQLQQRSNVTNSDGTRDAAASQERLNTLINQSFEIANRARTPVGTLAETYKRFDTALESVGKSQEESLRITETVAKALTLQGAAASETESVLRQLSQAFQKGKLDGDEFRSVAENIPVIIEAISETLGTSRSEIFRLSKEGAITIDVLAQAFENLGKRVDEEFARAPITVGQSLTVLTNRIIQEFARLDSRFGITSNINNFIDTLGRNLPFVIRLVSALGIGLATIGAFSIGAGLISFLSILTSIPVVVGSAVAFLAFFADEIKTTDRNAIRLTDSIRALVDQYTDASLQLAGQTGLSGDSIFSASGAQKVFDQINSIFQTIKQGAFIVTAAFGAVGKSLFENFDLNGLITEPLTTVSQAIVTGLVGAFQEVVSAVGVLWNALIDQIQKSINILSNSLGRFLDLLPNSIVSNKTTDALREGVNFDAAKVNVEALIEPLDKYKTEIEEVAPLWNKIFDDIGRNYNEVLNALIANDEAATLKREEIAQQYALNRLKEEEELAKRRQSNLDALRQAGTNTSGGGSDGLSAQDRLGILNSPLTDNALAQFSKFDISTIQNVRNSIDQTSKSIQTMGESASQSTDVINKGSKQSVQAIQTIDEAASNTGNNIGTSLSQGASTAQSAIQQMANSAIGDLNRIQSSATAAAAAVSRLNAVKGGFGGKSVGFAAGGYTGNVGRSQVAGFVHGQEYVMPADQTARYRPLLDAMRSGNLSSNRAPISGGNNNVNIMVENHSNASIEVEQVGLNEVRIIARQEIARNSDQAIANAIKNPNSRTSKELSRNTKAGRRF